MLIHVLRESRLQCNWKLRWDIHHRKANKYLGIF